MNDPSPLQQKDQIADMLFKAALRACRNQLLIFAKVVKSTLVRDGMPKFDAAETVKRGFDGYKDLTTFEQEFRDNVHKVLTAYLQPNYRGKDPLGRLIVEYSFIRSGKKGMGMLFPEDSEQDKTARERFVKGVIPRPVVQYFLISIRGTVDGVDSFKFLPMLFGFDDPDMDERRKEVTAIIESHKKTLMPGKTVTDWQRVYEDQRSKNIMLPFLRLILERVAALGGKRYMNILENIQRKDESMNEVTRMERQITPEDVDQLASAVARGIKRLEEELGVAAPA